MIGEENVIYAVYKRLGKEKPGKSMYLFDGFVSKFAAELKEKLPQYKVIKLAIPWILETGFNLEFLVKKEEAQELGGN